MYPPADKVFFCLFPPGASSAECQFPIYWYGVLIVAGMLLGAYVASREARRRGIDPEHVWGALTWALVLGLIGARLYHVLTPPPSMGITALDYLTFRDMDGNGWPDIIDLRRGGLGIMGAIIGGLIGIAIYCRRNKLNFLTAADLGGIGMPLGQFIGRWGNFFNQELYGVPTSLPWGLRIDAQYRVPPYNDLQLYPVDTTRFHPAFLYESLWNLLAFGIVFAVSRRYGKRLLKGELIALYIVLYGVGRVMTETVRVDSPFFPPIAGVSLNIAQVIAVLGIALVLALVYARRRYVAAGRLSTDSPVDVPEDQIAMTDKAYAAEAAEEELEEELEAGEDEEDEEYEEEEDAGAPEDEGEDEPAESDEDPSSG